MRWCEVVCGGLILMVTAWQISIITASDVVCKLLFVYLLGLVVCVIGVMVVIWW